MPQAKVTPFLWFDHQAVEAANFYVSLFPNSRVIRQVPGPQGSVLLLEFELDGIPFVALNGGPHYQLNEAFSLSIDCRDQQEVDWYWEKLLEGGTPSQCGWLACP